jgi:leucyl/phenylalanyl-tRNA--protein transferase
MVKLVEHLRQKRFTLFDAQLQNAHLERFGSYLVTDKIYQELLAQALLNRCFFT